MRLVGVAARLGFVCSNKALERDANLKTAGATLVHKTNNKQHKLISIQYCLFCCIHAVLVLPLHLLFSAHSKQTIPILHALGCQCSIGRTVHFGHHAEFLVLHDDHAPTGAGTANNSDAGRGAAASTAFRGGDGNHSHGLSSLARAALGFGLLAVRGLFADEGAFGFGAVRRSTQESTRHTPVSKSTSFHKAYQRVRTIKNPPVAAPVTHGVLAHSLALGLWVGALSVADGITAHGLALRATTLLAVLDWAADLALGAVAFDKALGATQLLRKQKSANQHVRDV